MYALTTLILQRSDHTIHAGTLFGTPAELLSNEQIRRYCSAPLGWSTCPLGYSVYAVNSHNGVKIVVPGLVISSEKKPRRKFPGYLPEFSKEKVELFARSIVDEQERVEESATVELQSLAHDIRALSAEIYTAAELVKNDLSERQYAAATYRTETVIAAQQMLSIRLDILDFATGQFLEQNPESIPVYKKAHKVINCFRPKSVASEISLNFQGPSSGKTYGPPIFELIPFVLVQNAIKYAPQASEIVVKVSDFDMHIDLHVQSMGPKIRAAEFDRLFERGFRGVEAQKTGKAGSGLGLHAAYALTESGFGGSLSVAQDNHPAVIAGSEYFRTTFSVQVPRVA